MDSHPISVSHRWQERLAAPYLHCSLYFHILVISLLYLSVFSILYVWLPLFSLPVWCWFKSENKNRLHYFSKLSATTGLKHLNRDRNKVKEGEITRNTGLHKTKLWKELFFLHNVSKEEKGVVCPTGREKREEKSTLPEFLDFFHILIDLFWSLKQDHECRHCKGRLLWVSRFLWQSATHKASCRVSNLFSCTYQGFLCRIIFLILLKKKNNLFVHFIGTSLTEHG